jgi:hypothetical protein
MMIQLFSCSEKKDPNRFIDCGDISFNIDTARFAFEDTTFIARIGWEVLFRKIYIRNNTSNDIYFGEPFPNRRIIHGFGKSYFNKRYNGWSEDFVAYYNRDSILLKLKSQSVDTFIIFDPFINPDADTVLFEIGYYSDIKKRTLVKVHSKIFKDKTRRITSDLNKGHKR